MPHTCSYYCQDGLHVSQALIRPSLSAADILAAYQQAWRRPHREVVAARPAHEVAVTTWDGLMRFVTYPHRVRVRRTTEQIPPDFVPWLIVWRSREEAPDA